MHLSYCFPPRPIGMETRRDPLRSRMNIDYATLEQDIESGDLQRKLALELTIGFRLMQEAGDPLPPASYYATKIAEIIHANAESELSKDMAYYLYQEILLACEEARVAVLGKPE